MIASPTRLLDSMRAAASARTTLPLLLSASPRKAIPSLAPPPARALSLAPGLGLPSPCRLPLPRISSMAVASVAAPERHDAGDWYSVPDLSLRDHRFTVPLDYSAAAGSSITVFAREVVAVGKEEEQLPYLLYLQGGPGFESPRPTEASGWLKRACEEYRVVLLDQRGTGLSTPLTVSSLSQIMSATKLVEYLQHFRADNIIKDAEFLRSCLVPDSGTWTVLGQSYGGFCAVTYMSFAPEGLKSVLLTGGIPPIAKGCTADVVYRACFEQVVHQNEKYYKRFPQDVKVICDLVNYLAKAEGGGVSLPSGGILTPRGLQTLGLAGLGSGGGFERLHYMFERVWDPELVPGTGKRISYYFLKAMIFPWMFDEIHALGPFTEAAHLLAEKEDWPPLYDISRLNNNKVPVAAAVYYEDMYVNFKLAMETASEIAGIRLWVTNEYMHSGLRDNGYQVFEQLIGMLQGKKPWF
ncbi:uncharacterized protein LOC135641866 isoform X2 [Musa acuminata AAA Group]|uniref:uncharacterized protein LOC135641866 isoform X2 n=1 Tax=Musa acuminata AAA Group TaxID=214697 RepID=UPI0031D5B8A6